MARCILLIMLIAGGSGCAPVGVWTGVVADDVCRDHHEWDEHGPARTQRDCTLICVDRGAKFVLVSDGQVYGIAGDHSAVLRQAAGTVVTARGSLRAGVITVTAWDQAPSY